MVFMVGQLMRPQGTTCSPVDCSMMHHMAATTPATARPQSSAKPPSLAQQNTLLIPSFLVHGMSIMGTEEGLLIECPAILHAYAAQPWPRKQRELLRASL